MRRQHLLYIASSKQLEATKQSLRKWEPIPQKGHLIGESYLIRHESLADLELSVHMISALDAMTHHLRQYPVDLLIYDERFGGIDAVKAIEQIHDDMEALEQLWGADFHFPMGRVVVLLEDSKEAAQKSFQLGRFHVKDVLVKPKNLTHILRWIARLLQEHQKQNSFRVGMAMGGGGMEGCLYQLGCCYALEKALSHGRSIYDCDVFSGVSSGSIVASMMATQAPLKEMILAVYGRSQILPKFDGSILYDVAMMDVTKRLTKEVFSWPRRDQQSLWQKAMRGIPTGFFKGDRFKNYLWKAFRAMEVPNHFKDLSHELYIGATLQDTFEPMVFGLTPWDKVPIHEAIRASCALPPVFTPAIIQERSFLDGQITKTCNLELVIKRGCNLVFIIDPLVPYTPSDMGEVEALGGVFTLIQTIKTLVHTRFRIFLRHITERFPQVDFIVLQPLEECAKAMAGSPMKYRLNPHLIELAYKTTLSRLRERHTIYEVKMEKHGFCLASPRELLEWERTGLAL